MSTERNREDRVPAEPRRTPTGRGTPRTLAEELRSRDADSLAALLLARPDLLAPVPGDLTQLATRAATRASVVRALERLDRFVLQTAEALAVAPDPCAYPTLLGLMTGDEADPVVGRDIVRELPRALAALRTQALIWGGTDRTHLVRTARELLAPTTTGSSPTGLGPPVAEAAAGVPHTGGRERLSPGRLQEIIAAAGLPATHDPVTAATALAGLFTDRPRMAALLADCPPEARATLGKLVWGPPYGTVPAAPAAPVQWLLDRGLLLPAGPRTVVLPREVALHLRGGRAHRIPEPLPPVVRPVTEHPPRLVDATAAGQSHTALATIEELLKGWETGGPPVLRAGGLSVRDLKRSAAALDVGGPTAAFWIEVAFAAGLLASDGEADERFAATPAYDAWLRQPAEKRWAVLATAWLATTRTPGLVGGQDAKGRTLAALGPDLDRPPAPEVRRRVLELLATLPAGASAPADALLARLRWARGLPSDVAPEPVAPEPVAPEPGDGDGGPESARTGTASGPTDPGSGPPGPGSVPGGPGGGRSGTESAPTGPAPTSPASGRSGRTRGRAGSAAVTAPPGTTPPAEDLRTRIARWTLTEAELLGITGRGALSTHGRALLGPLPPTAGPAAGPDTASETGADTGSGTRADTGSGTEAAEPWPPGAAPAGTSRPRSPAEAAAAADSAAALLAPALPQPLDHVLLQADLTAVAPGPLRRSLAALLDLLADVESKGGATVYRFTPASVRRALDAGRSAAELHAFLTEHSRTPVPQPLSYLIDDVARRHGLLRVGAACAYLRCDDDALLTEILADRRSAPLGLRRLAPTVLAAQAAPEVLLERLRGMGYAPAAESAAGEVLVARADAHRTPPRSAPRPVTDGPPVPDDTLLGAAVKAIRAGDLAATAVRKPVPSPQRPGAPLPRTTSAETLAAMRAAARANSVVWIGYVNADGAASQRVIAPVRVEGGFVTAYDHTADEIRTYPLHRITGVAELADDHA